MKKEIQKELDSLGSKLSRIEKKNNYSVPEGYFDSLAEQVIQKAKDTSKEVERNENSSPMAGNIFSFLKSPYSMGIAASVILLIGLFQFVDFTGTDTTLELTEQQVFAYLDQNIEELDEELLIEFDLLDEADIAMLGSEFSDIDDQYFEEIIYDFDTETLEEVFN